MANFRENWHHALLCEKLDKLISGEIKCLLVSMPPRHGKSEIVSRRLPAYLFGLNPDEHVMGVSYADDLASRMNRDVQRIIDSPGYRTVFPETLLNSKDARLISADAKQKVRNSTMFEIVDFDGMYRSAGVGGGITGMGFRFGSVDDPIKNKEQAASATVRQAQWEWFTTTFLSRREKGARVLVTMTRWNEDDIAGRLLAMKKNGLLEDDWDVLSLPAINTDGPSPVDPRQVGEALWPDEFPVSFLNEQKVLLGTRDFDALYQQNPGSDDGGVIKRAWTQKLYHVLPAGCQFLISADLAIEETETGSYNVVQVWAWKGANIYLVHQWRKRCEFAETLVEFVKVVQTYPQASIRLVEKKANGSALMSVLKDKIPGLIGVVPRESKKARLSATAPLWEAGNIWLPSWAIAPWIGEFVEELVKFPNAANDDQADTASQAVNRIKREIGVIVRPASETRDAPIPQ